MYTRNQRRQTAAVATRFLLSIRSENTTAIIIQQQIKAHLLVAVKIGCAVGCARWLELQTEGIENVSENKYTTDGFLNDYIICHSETHVT